MSAESTSFIIDVSLSMVSEGHLSKIIAYLEYTLLDKCKRGRKTDWVSLYLANCLHTKNSQEIPNVYQIQDFLAPVTSAEAIKSLKELRVYAKSVEEDALPKKENAKVSIDQMQSMVQCLLVASLDIRAEFKNRKILRQIVIFTADIEGLDLSEEEIAVLKEELNSRLILVDCRKKSDVVADGDEIYTTKWGMLLKAVPGSVIYNVDDLLMEITLPKPNLVKPVRVFSGELRLGVDVGILLQGQDAKMKSPMEDKKCLCIRVEGYPATKPISSLNRKLVLKSEVSGTTQYETVKSLIEYEVQDEKANKRISVSSDSIAKAYRYGSDYVVLPSTLDEQRFYRTRPGIDIRGFLDCKRLPRYFLNSESRFILADTRLGSVADTASLNVLVDILLEQDKVAVVRYVAKPDTEVQMCVMCPLTLDNGHNDKIRTFVLNRLPFAEDERVAGFPKLTARTTTSGKEIKDDKESSEVDALMSDYVDSLDMNSTKLEDQTGLNYYPLSGQCVKDTTLPLPDDDDETVRLQSIDPQMIPAIHLHRQKQVLLEWVHQKLVNGSEDFQVPDMPDLLKEKISQHFKLRDDGKLAKLVNLLDIKENERRSMVNDEHFDEAEDEEAAQNIPSLESILARGERSAPQH